MIKVSQLDNFKMETQSSWTFILRLKEELMDKRISLLEVMPLNGWQEVEDVLLDLEVN